MTVSGFPSDLDSQAEECPDGGGEIDGICVVVPDGEYEVRYDYYETTAAFRNTKVELHCAIIMPEEFAGVPISRYYNVPSLTGPPKRYGKFKAKPRGSLVREFRRLFDQPDRLDRISFARLKGRRLIVRVRTVTRGPDYQELPKHDQYSVIAELINIRPDDDW